jgi:hypothetical protein
MMNDDGWMDGKVLAARRDASFYRCHGTSRRYHIVVGDYVSACNPQRMLVVKETAIAAEDVTEGLRCRRPGCAVRWPKKRSTP